MTYHDAIAETGVYAQAAARLPADMQEARSKRMKRAFDLSQKHVDIPAELQEDPWREYKTVNTVFADTQMEHDERRHLSDRWW